MFEAGDAQFLDQDRLHELQIRPLLNSERPSSIAPYPPGTMMLVVRGPIELRAVVKLSYPYRKNLFSNCIRALEQVERFDPQLGSLFRAAMAIGARSR